MTSPPPPRQHATGLSAQHPPPPPSPSRGHPVPALAPAPHAHPGKAGAWPWGRLPDVPQPPGSPSRGPPTPPGSPPAFGGRTGRLLLVNEVRWPRKNERGVMSGSFQGCWPVQHPGAAVWGTWGSWDSGQPAGPAAPLGPCLGPLPQTLATGSTSCEARKIPPGPAPSSQSGV